MMRIITGSARGTKLAAPEGMTTRPTAERAKEAVFSSLQFGIRGRTVLDLFAGSGQMGLEALSRGAAFAVFCDSSPEAVAVIKKNAEKTHLSDRCRIVGGDSLDFCEHRRGRCGSISFLLIRRMPRGLFRNVLQRLRTTVC